MNNLTLAIRRGAALITVCFIFLLLLCAPAFAYTYGSVYPDYLPSVGLKYVEVQSSLGRGSVIVSSSIPDTSLALSSVNNNLYNTTGSNISGIFRLSNGTDYTIRFTSYSYPEYATTSGYNTVWTALTVSEIYNTNFKFVDYKNMNKQNDTFFVTDNVQRLYISLFIVVIIVSLFNMLILLCRRFER